MIYTDKALSQRLELTEGRANVDFVETRKRLFPDSDAAWIEVGGTYAMFDGLQSPLTQTFGLGIFEEATPEVLERIENFYTGHGSPVFHEVSPMADMSLLALLGERGYRPMELSSVMYLELDNLELPPPLNRNITTRILDSQEADIWAETAAKGWATEYEGLADFMLGFGKIAARTVGGRPFVAELDGQPIATGGFQVYEDVCILAGASTIPEARRIGAQNALLSARLRFARQLGCNLAMMCALPGSQSQKNAQKNGFDIAYTRIKWHLA
jgi:GNAT superfamily N-acetyltransferase